MAENTLKAKRFSQAVFEIAQERSELDKWQVDLQTIALLAQNSEFVSVMENPKFAFDDKKKLLDSQLKGISQLALNLTYMLTSLGEFSLVTPIYASYQKLLDDLRGIDKAEVTSAVPLDDTEKQRLAQSLGDLTGNKIILTVKVDPGILGGIIARVGGKILDGSTRSQLTALKNELAGAGR